MAARKKVKYFVLDTNVLIHDPDAFREFGDNTVVICEEVLEELDSLKKRSDDTDGSVAASARKVSRGLAEFLNGGDIREGVKLPNGGMLVVSLDSKYPLKFKRDTPDNRILSFAYGLSEEGKTVFVISKDTNVRLKASGLGLIRRTIPKINPSFSRSTARSSMEMKKSRMVSCPSGIRLKEGKFSVIGKRNHASPYGEADIFGGFLQGMRSRSAPWTRCPVLA